MKKIKTIFYGIKVQGYKLLTEIGPPDFILIKACCIFIPGKNL